LDWLIDGSSPGAASVNYRWEGARSTAEDLAADRSSGRRVGEGADCDEVGARVCIAAYILRSNPARCLDRYGRTPAPCPGAELLGGLVVDQEMRHPGGQGLFELGFGFHFNNHRRSRWGTTQRRREGIAVSRQQLPVIVLPENRICERGAVVHAASHTYRV